MSTAVHVSTDSAGLEARATATAVVARRPAGYQPVIAAGLLFALGVLYLQRAVHWRQAALFIVGTFAGVVLYHAAFGFTSAWRAFIVDRRGAGVRAQMLMLALACAVFFPAIGTGELFGQAVHGSSGPLAVSVAVGAFLFGVGMQLGGGCASGTLYSAGGGNLRTGVTLLAFIAGSVIGAAHMPWWQARPSARAVSLVSSLGVWPALALNLALFGAIALATRALERGRRSEAPRLPSGWTRALRGPWPLMGGAIGLALVNVATLALAGRPWGVTSAFALWGSKALMALGIDVASWPYWSARTAELRASVVHDVTSVMNFGILLGAFAAAGLAGRLGPARRIPVRSLVAALIGGLLLGYGARIAYGCNIGAFFSGVASGSLHGWLWLAAAFPGNIVGTRLRPLFGLSRR